MTNMKQRMQACLAIMALCVCRETEATITIVETGERFSSRPARLGTGFREGFEYMSRLQYLPHNLELCPDDEPSPFHHNDTVIQPSDGLPVTLLARKGGCSYETKARYARYAVNPPNVVKYVIIYDDNDHRFHDFPIKEKEVQLVETSSEEPRPLVRRLTKLARNRKRPKYDDIDLKVLLVSHKSGLEMLSTLQIPEHMAAGGPRILMDGRSWTPLQRNVMFWMGLSLLLSACMCSFLMSMQISRFNNNFDDTEEVVQRVPRRLTVREVATLLPEIEYNGTDQSTPLVAGTEESNDGISPEDASTPILSLFHQSHQGDCSICLDEYVRGDKIRSLPCGHGFHSACITKWLTERSSTCPLCKAILEGVDDSDDDSSSVASNGSLVELREGGTQTGHDDDDDDETNMGAMYHSLVDSLRRTRRRNTIWWRRRWQGRPLFRVQESADIQATPSSHEPLLENEADGMIETVEAS